MLVWWSFGLVVGGGQDRLGNVTGRHFLLGIIATAIQHAQFITGLRRQEENERKIFNYVLIHSVGGYFSHFVACKLIVHAFFEITLVMHGFGTHGLFYSF